MSRRLDNWLAAYQEYSEGTESPDSYHLWCALGTLAAAAQRKIYLDLDYFKIHSNMFVVLTGPAGGPRKGTALGMARDILTLAEDYGADLEIGPQKASAAALISRMTRISNPDHQSLTVYSMELGSLLGASNTDVTDALTDLWDCNPKWDKETIGRGAEKITAPWLNIVSATTPVWLADNLPKTAAEGGFVARIMPIYEETKARRVAIPSMTDQQKLLREDLAHDLAHIALLGGPFRFSDDARAFYEDWYNEEKNFVPKYENRMYTFYDRKHVHVTKTAMMLSLARSDALVLEEMDFKAAIQLVEDVERSMAQAFQGVGRNIVSLDHERIKRQIIKAGASGVPHKQLIRANIHALDMENINRILATLRETGEAGMVNKVWYTKGHIKEALQA